jgi:hypothetical protein
MVTRFAQAGEPGDNDPAVIAARAEKELQAKPKAVTAAMTMVHFYNGHALALHQRFGGLPVPDVRNPRKAEAWRQRVIEACKDPTTIGCGNRVRIYPDGALATISLADLIGMDAAGTFEGASGIIRSHGVAQPITISIFNAGQTLGEIAALCAVRGLGYGGDAASFKEIAASWVGVSKSFRQATGEDPNFFAECHLPRPFFTMKGRGGGPVMELQNKGQNIHVDQDNFKASTAIWRIEPDHFFFAASVPVPAAR